MGLNLRPEDESHLEKLKKLFPGIGALDLCVCVLGVL